MYAGDCARPTQVMTHSYDMEELRPELLPPSDTTDEAPPPPPAANGNESTAKAHGPPQGDGKRQAPLKLSHDTSYHSGHYGNNGYHASELVVTISNLVDLSNTLATSDTPTGGTNPFTNTASCSTNTASGSTNPFTGSHTSTNGSQSCMSPYEPVVTVTASDSSLF